MILGISSKESLPVLCSNELVGRVPRGIKNPLCQKLAERLVRTQERTGRSFRALSIEGGLSKNVASPIIRRAHTPAIDTLEMLAAALGVPAGWLAYGYEGLEPFRERYPRPITEPSDPTPDPALRVFRDLTAGFPQRIRDARERSGLSMRTLSSAAGVSVQAWSNAEAGKALPRVDTCERMAVALGVAPRWLAYGEGNAPN